MLECKEIYVSRYHGKNLPSCGKTIRTSCKTIAFATTQAQWNDTIYLDGTETSRDPYPCLTMKSYPGGIYVNKSLSFERFGEDEVFLKCSPTTQLRFDGRNVSGKVIIRFVGLTFLNSHVTVQKCSLYVEGCLFKDTVSFPNATAVVNIETFEEQCYLTIRKSMFSGNGFPCIRVLGSRPKVEVHDTAFFNNTAVGHSTEYTWVYLAVLMVLFPTEHLGYPGSSVTLTNTSFIRNTVPLGGCVHIEGILSEAANRENKKRHKNNISRSIQKMNIVSQPFYSTKHDKIQSTTRGRLDLNVSEAAFSHNFGRAIHLTTVSNVNISIARSDFFNNSSPIGGAMFCYETPILHCQIENSTFVENSAESDGSAIYVGELDLSADSLDSEVTMVLFRNVLFLRNVVKEPNSSPYDGGALALDCPYHTLSVLLVNVSFLHNKAAKGCSTLYSNAYFQDITIEDSSFLRNSQDERYPYEWTIAQISSYNLSFNLIRTVISGNYATPRAYRNLLESRPIHFLVTSNGPAQINISGLQYKTNKGGGIYIQLNNVITTVNSTIVSIQDSHFENNELFSMNILNDKNVFLQIKRFVFRANSFASSYFSRVPLFFISTLSQGNQITMEHAIFENNTASGRIVLFRLPPDDLDHHVCNISKWDYNNHIRLTNVMFRENNALNSTVLRFESSLNILRNCRFIDNSAVYTIFVGESSTNLELINTSFEKTPQWAESRLNVMFPLAFRGFIYYASYGPIALTNTTLIAESFQDIDSYFMVTGSSSAPIDNSSVIECPTGTLQTLRNFTHPRLVSNEYCNPVIYDTIAQSFTFSCKRCSTGFYSVEPFAEKCRPCPYGGNCTNNIAAKPTFWGFPSLSDRGSVSFQQCPIDYCCPYRNISCPYDNQRYLSNGCSGNRTGFLCGECKPGFTETLFSPRCRASNDCNDYWFWPVALFYSLAFAFFLLWKYPIMRFIKRLLPWEWPTQPRNTSLSESNGCGSVKVIFYFYQVASLVFVSKDIEMQLAENYLLLPVIGWFDFKAISSNKGLICPYRGLTAVSKMFLQASQVFAVLSGTLVIFLLHGAVRKLQKQSPVFPPSGQYLAATIECLLLGYSTLASTALKAMNCVPIQSTSRFFYDGNVQCWQWWQKLCGVFIFVFIVPFVFVLYRGSKLLYSKVMTTKQFLYACLFPLPFAFCWMFSCKKIPRNETETHDVNGEQLPLLPPDRSTRGPSVPDPTHGVVYGPFQECHDSQTSGAVYWESVLIGRRLVLICLHTFIVFPFIRMVCLSVTCAFILAHHMWKKPFKDPLVNHGETASLTALLVLAVINMAEVTFAINGEILSEQERICSLVFHVVEVVILGAIPVALVLFIVLSVLRHLLKFCKLCWVNVCRLFVK